MTIRDFAIVAAYDTIIKVYGPGKNEAITAFQSQFWGTIDTSVLDLVIRDLTISKESRRTAVIETISGRPIPVRTLEELDNAISDPLMPDIKLFADISSDENYAVYLSGKENEKSLDLNGHTLDFSEASDETGDSSVAIYVTQGAKLRIFDSRPENKVGLVIAARDTGENGVNIAVGAFDGAVVNIYGGSFCAENSQGADQSYTVYSDGGYVHIFGGAFGNYSYDGEGGTAQVLKCISEGISGGISCFGGLYDGQNPEGYISDSGEYRVWKLVKENGAEDRFTVLKW